MILSVDNGPFTHQKGLVWCIVDPNINVVRTNIGCKQVVVKDAISSSISNQQFVMEEPIKDVIFVEAFQIMHK